VITLKHNKHHPITFSLCLSGCYNSCTAAKHNLKLMNQLRANSPTKANTDHHNGVIPITIFSFPDSAC